MKIEEFYEYLGDSGHDTGYVKGNEYALQVIGRTKLERIIGVFSGVPYKYCVVIIKPIAVTYPSYESFLAHWNLKFMRVSNESE